MIKVLLIVLALLFSPIAYAQCVPISAALAQAEQTWTKPLEVVEGQVISIFLQAMMPSNDFSEESRKRFTHVLKLHVRVDPQDNEVIVVGERAGDCYDGYGTMPMELYYERIKAAREKLSG